MKLLWDQRRRSGEGSRGREKKGGGTEKDKKGGEKEIRKQVGREEEERKRKKDRQVYSQTDRQTPQYPTCMAPESCLTVGT